jgi:hypothetical protein
MELTDRHHQDLKVFIEQALKEARKVLKDNSAGHTFNVSSPRTIIDILTRTHFILHNTTVPPPTPPKPKARIHKHRTLDLE